MPQCRPKEAWVGAMARMALHCLEVTAQEYRVDPQRVYLTGLSLGGQGTWIIGAEFADKFAALVPICGFAEYQESTGLAAKLAGKLTKMPIWVFHGDADPAVPVAKSREMVEEIRKAGGEVKYTEYPGEGHNVWDKAYDDHALWEWLFAQRRANP
jgi:predicted peptidase